MLKSVKDYKLFFGGLELVLASFEMTLYKLAGKKLSWGDDCSL